MATNAIKTGKARQRTQRKVPELEAIVRVKDDINDRTSKLIELLKKTKSGWNGKPVPELGINEKTNLVDPLPDAVIQSAEIALRELGEIIRGLHQVDNMQDSHAEARTRRINERLQQMKQVQQQQVQQANINNSIIKEASNPLTRAWSHIAALSPFSGEKNRWERLSLLRSFAAVEKKLKILENTILSTGPASVLDSSVIANELYNDVTSVFFHRFRDNINEMLEGLSNSASEISDELNQIQGAEKEANKAKDISEKAKKKSKTKPPVVEGPVLNTEEVRNEAEAAKAVHDIPLGDLPEDKPKQETTKEDILKYPPAAFDEDFFDYEDDPDMLLQNLEFNEEKPESEKLPLQPEPEVIQEENKDSEENEQEDIESEFGDPNISDKERYSNIIRHIIFNSSHLLNEIYGELNETYPEPWYAVLRNRYERLFALANEIRSGEVRRGLDDYSNLYRSFLKEYGSLKAELAAFAQEESFSQSNPEFTFGITYNDDKIREIEQAGKEFSDAEFEQLSKAASLFINDGFIVEGSALSRFVKRNLITMFNKRDGTTREYVSRSILRAISSIQSIMDMLESKQTNHELYFNNLIDKAKVLYSSLQEVYNGLGMLTKMYAFRENVEKARAGMPSRTTWDKVSRAMLHIEKSIIVDLSKLQELDDMKSKVIELENKLFDKTRAVNG